MHRALISVCLASCLLLAACSPVLEAQVDFAQADKATGLDADNVSVHETDGKLHWRWFLGPESTVGVHLAKPQRIKLDFLAFSQIAGQHMRILANGQELGAFDTPQVGPYAFSLGFDGKKGKNELRFVFSDWNHGKTTFAADDPRSMAMAFYRFLITPMKPTP